MIDELPQDSGVERAVLGGMLSSIEVCRDVLDVVTPADFYRPQHEAICEACRRLESRGEPVDPITVAAELGDKADHLLLADLYGQAGVASNARHHAHTVADLAVKRRLQQAAIKIGQDVVESSLPAADLVENARALFDAAMPSKTIASPLGESVASVLDVMESGAVRGLSTGWPDMDKHIYGLRPGSLYVVGARPSVGKSIVGLQLASVMWDKHQKATYLASLEMTADEIVQRSIAARARVPLDRIIPGRLTEDDWGHISPVIWSLESSMIHIADEGRQTMASIRSGARTLHRKGSLGLVVIDYLQLIAPRDAKLPREQQVSEASRGAKLIAKELAVPVVLLSQLNRATGEHGVPALSNLRESGAIEQDADVVILMHRPDDDAQNIDLHIAKNRSGPLGVVHMIRQGEYARLVPAAR